MTNIRICTPEDVRAVALMVGELLHEIMAAIGEQAFRFDVDETTARLAEFVSSGKYFVLVAHDAENRPAGFINLCESYALYAEGAFGTITELYVRPPYRADGLGRRLVEDARAFARSRGWTRLEVTTPPLPQFARTLAFYEREGFSISGGRKLKVSL